jgi:hypothetical protein
MQLAEKLDWKGLTTKYVIESLLRNMWEMQTNILITTVDGTRQHGRFGCILAFLYNYVLSTHILYHAL